MSFRVALALVASLPGFAFAQDHAHMRILLNGTPVGENTYERTADGTFTSKSALDLGSIRIASDVVGHLKDGKLTDATANTTGPGGDATVLLAHGRVEIKSGKKSI